MEDVAEKHATLAYPPKGRESAAGQKASAIKSFAKSAKLKQRELFILAKHQEAVTNGSWST